MGKRVVFLLFLVGGNIITGFSGPGPGFIENKNQWHHTIDFMVNIPGGQMTVQSGQFNYFFWDYNKINQMHEQSHRPFNEVFTDAIPDELIQGRRVNIKFVGSKPATGIPSQRGETYYNFFLGNDRQRWGTRAYAYKEIAYEGLYEGIDMKLYNTAGSLKYDLLVGPGADPAQIQIEYTGVRSLRLADGHLVLDAELAKITEQAPVAFQWINGVKRNIKCEFDLVGNRVSFTFPQGYDPCFELVIDPLLIFSTYSGSAADNWGSTATPGEHGLLYSGGLTNQFVGNVFSGEFPVTPGAFQTNYGGVYDIAILKFDSLGQNLLYASYLGGSSSESPHSLVMDQDENLIVLGTTSSADFPTTGQAFDQSFDGGTAEQHVVAYPNGSDIIVAKISRDGSTLLASTFLGGSANDGLNPTTGVLAVNYGDQLRGDIITDGNRDIFVSTVTSSLNFPVANSFGMTYNGGATDALVLKISADLSQVVWGSFIGGASSDASHTLKFDSQGNLLVGGGTASIDFPTTSGVYQVANAGGVDGWLARLESDGSAINAATLTGTAAFNQVYFVDLNAEDEVYVYGQTTGQFPITPGVFNNPNSGQFLQKFDKDLTTLMFSTVFGSGRGLPDISPTAFLVNECNNIYMTGWGGQVNIQTQHWNNTTLGMPVTPDAFQSTSSGSDFYFIVLTDDAKEFLYGTYMGGNFSRTHVDGGTSRFDKGGIVYHAVCSGCAAFNATGQATSDFPTTQGAWSGSNNSNNCNNAAFKFDLSSLRARIVTNSVALDQPGLLSICFPDPIVFQNKSTGGQFFEWDLGDNTSQVKPDTAAIIHQYAAPGKYLVKLRAVDAGTCIGEDFDFATITVNQPTGFAGEDKAICEDSEVQLLAGGGIQYQWMLGDSLVSNLAQPVFTLQDSALFQVFVLDGNGCLVKDSVQVDVVPGFDLRFDFKRVFDCNSRPSLEVINLSEPAEGLFFDFGDGNSSDQAATSHRFEKDGNYVVRLVGRRDFCEFEKSVMLPFFTLKVPNVITPGSPEGKNDTFKIIYGDQLTSQAGVGVSLFIYNRWGKPVMLDKDYKNDWNAEGLQAGTYYFEVDIQDETMCKGWVQVIR